MYNLFTTKIPRLVSRDGFHSWSLQSTPHTRTTPSSLGVWESNDKRSGTPPKRTDGSTLVSVPPSSRFSLGRGRLNEDELGRRPLVTPRPTLEVCGGGSNEVPVSLVVTVRSVGTPSETWVGTGYTWSGYL